MTHKNTSEPQDQALNHSKTFDFNSSSKKLININLYYLVGITVLIVSLIYVIFYLPQTISKPKLETDSKVFMEKELNKAIDESPWHEAQLAKYRKKSQLILAIVLEKQNKLESHHVNLWDENQFKQALEKAKMGDLSYRSQEFDKAISLYNQSLDTLSKIELEIPIHYEKYLKKGTNALEKNNAKEAKSNLQIAMYLQPNATAAQEKYDRSLVLNQVLSLNKEGLVLMKNKALDLARKRLLKAASLDVHSKITQENLKQINEKIIHRDYSKAMSQGYVNLNKKNFNSAIEFFTKAQKISPESSDPKTAIIQSKNEKTQNQISKILKLAAILESELKWRESAAQYNKALSIDSSLITARVGLIRSNSKADLENKLKFIINNPMRLSNNNVYQEAKITYNVAIKIQNPDKNLVSQIVSVKQILQKSKLPINVEIFSDDLTLVTIFRVGEMGHFTNKQLSLKPGEYTLIGSRSGYRDIRKVVTLIPGSQNTKIHVKCIEKINNG